MSLFPPIITVRFFLFADSRLICSVKGYDNLTWIFGQSFDPTGNGEVPETSRKVFDPGEVVHQVFV